MILQALNDYYNQLLRDHPDRIAQPGWCSRRVIAMLDLSPDGELINIIPADEKRGWEKMVPQQVKRSTGVAANFLCDNSSYLLGVDEKGKPKRSMECFNAAKSLHLAILAGVDDPAAHAVTRFFETWDPSRAGEHEVLQACNSVLSGGNLVFRVQHVEVLEDASIREAWDSYYFSSSEDAQIMTCLVTGQQEPIARLHPAIKGVTGTQSTGATLVGFNNPAFESYGREQGFNSPVSEKAAFAYTTALNYLLSQRNHRTRLGDTTVVYWASEHDEECCELFGNSMGDFYFDDNEKITTQEADAIIDSIMTAVSKGRPVQDISMDIQFNILGLAPNAARVSVRFFLQSTFGEALGNLCKHYERLELHGSKFDRRYLTPYFLLRETENPNSKNKDATSILGGALMRSILSNTYYPEALYENTLLRIHRAQDDSEKHTRKITHGRASIVKAYLLKNRRKPETEVTVMLNADNNNPGYVLGRLFSVLEAVQESANPGLNTTIMNRYYDSASTTPSSVFPTICKLSKHHLDKLSKEKPGLASFYNQQLRSIYDKLDHFPRRLTLDEQGEFVLGYEHQTIARYEKTTEGEK